MTVTDVSRLDVLSRLARRKGWALLLRSSADGCRRGRNMAAELTSLTVVAPDFDTAGPRRRRIIAGDVIARIPVTGPAELELAAALVLEQLHRQGLINSEGR